MAHTHDDGCAHCHDPHHGGRRVPPAEVLLRLSRVGIRHGRDTDWAVHGVDLEVGPGEVVSLIGPNGAGKTTLLRAVAGLLPVTEGAVEWPAGRAPLGYVPQQQPPDRSLPVSVAEFLRLQPDRPSKERIAAALDEMGIGGLGSRRLGELSGGEMQRVAIAYALLGDPLLLLLDEPLTGVNVRGGKDFEELVAHLRRDRGIAMLLVSHDLHMVGAVSDIVVCLNRHLCATGTPAQVLQDHVLSGIYGGKVAAPRA